MIIDKKKGLKVAENKTEAFWFRFAENKRAIIRQLKAAIQEQKSILKKSAREIEQAVKENARADIKRFSENLKFERELMNFAESHVQYRDVRG